MHKKTNKSILNNLHYEKFSNGIIKCIEEEIPFDIPDSWCWVRLGNLGLYKKGPFGSSITKSMFISDNPEAIKVYEQKNAIQKDDTLGTYFISKEKYDTLKNFEVFPNDIIVSCAGTIGETYIMPNTMRKGIINQALMKITLFEKQMLKYYLLYFDFKLKQYAQKHGYGVALKNIPPFDILKQYLIPIPPLNEQDRIMNKISIFLNLIENINIDSNNIKNTILQIKSKILELAIQGKLVPQNPEDEPASVLLERIQAEKEELIKQGKIKRDKKESVIFKGDDNSYYRSISGNIELCTDFPFELPDGWEWCNLSMVSQIITKGTTPRGGNVAYVDKGIGFLRAENVSGFERLDTTDLKYVTEDAHNNFLKRSILYANDILITIAGTLGRTAIVPETELPLNTNQAISIVRPINCELLNLMYIIYAVNAPEISKKLLSQSVEMAIPNLSLDNISNCTFPLPPLTEQRRIVEAIKTSFEHLDNILNNL